MTLAAWLRREKIRRSHFAATIQVSPSYVTQLCRARFWPSRDVVLRIRAATQGEVTADDFLDAERGEKGQVR